MQNKKILDPCCGSKMFWFDKENKNAVFCDIREAHEKLCDGRTLCVSPDHIMDFTDMSFADETFSLVVFDPPHLSRIGEKSYMAKKYGVLKWDWKETIRKGFSECFRVLKKDGVLVFKWSDRDIKLKDVLSLSNQKPLFGNRTSKNTIWIVYMK